MKNVDTAICSEIDMEKILYIFVTQGLYNYLNRFRSDPGCQGLRVQ